MNFMLPVHTISSIPIPFPNVAWEWDQQIDSSVRCIYFIYLFKSGGIKGGRWLERISLPVLMISNRIVGRQKNGYETTYSKHHVCPAGHIGSDRSISLAFRGLEHQGPIKPDAQ